MENKIVPANLVPFGDLCSVLEQIVKKNKKPDKETCFIKFINDFKLNAAKRVGEKNSSFFPILRLIVPIIDRERGAYNLKEAKLGALLVKVLSLNKDSNDGKKLLKYTSVSTKKDGDFASIAYFVLKNRVCPTTSKLTVGDINEVLDKIAFMEAGNKGQMLEDIFSHSMRSLSAEHMKWFLRIIIKDLKLGMGNIRILSCYHPDAPELYDACGKLSKVCEDLEEGNSRPLEMGVQLFYAMSPMLSERLDVVDVNQLPARVYHIEEKFDGERFQMHMENGVFEYFSRKGHPYTTKYGRTYDSGLLTRHLKDSFDAHVTSCILDGEMMGWHKAGQYFGSTGMSFDIKKVTERCVYQPCFCAFDVLYYNGRSLVGPPEKGGLPLKERLQLLDKMFRDVPGVLLHSKRQIVQQNSDILHALNEVNEREREGEGIVVKDVDSYYIANKRNAGWYKIKPEYTDGATEDLDLVIIGADEAENKRQGRAKSFLVACADSVEGAAPHRWLCVGRVATGLTHEERERLCAHLELHWKSSGEAAPPPCLVLNKTKPDLWILPQHSIVLQVKATELIRSSDFATSYTLRFPRIMKIRDDKPVSDIMTLDEFNKLVGNKGAVIKLSTKRINEEQIGDTIKTRKKRTATVVQVDDIFKKVVHSDVEVTSQALRGRKICILSDDEDCKRDELARIIQTHGGEHVGIKGRNTWCCIVGELIPRAIRAINSGEDDVTSTTWLRSLTPSPTLCTIHPLDMLAMKRDTRMQLARDYDAYGDSYTEDIDVETLKRVIKKMENEPQTYLTNHEMLDLDKELFNGCNPHSFLRRTRLYVHSSNLAIHAKRYGATVCDIQDDITHAVLSTDTDVDKIREECNAFVVSEKWLEKCFLERKIVDECEFLL